MRLPALASGCHKAGYGYVSGLGARSPLAKRRPVPDCFCLTCLLKSSPFPRARISRPWDCKITPPYCTCQERNTTGCTLNNDGLGAGVVANFSTMEIHGAFIKPVASGQLPVKPYNERRPGLRLRRSREGWGDFRSRGDGRDKGAGGWGV